MDAAPVNLFIEGTLHILDTTAFVKVKPEPSFFRKKVFLESFLRCLARI